MVQYFLYNLCDLDDPKDHIEEYAETLEADLQTMIDDALGYMGETPQTLLDNLRLYQELFSEISVIPAGDDAEAILKRIPSHGAALFRTLANRAFAATDVAA